MPVQHGRSKYDWFIEFPTEDIFVEVVKVVSFQRSYRWKYIMKHSK